MLEEKDLMIKGNEKVAQLNHVPGFDPVKLLQKSGQGRARTGDEQAQLILKYKKLWFRLAFPNGRIRLTALRLTEEIAIVQAEIFQDKTDGAPVANYIGSRSIHNTPGGLYIQAAEYEAVDNALTDAGFGIQLCDVCKTWGEEAYTLAVGEPSEPAADQTGNRQEADMPAAQRPDQDVQNQAGTVTEHTPPEGVQHAAHGEETEAAASNPAELPAGDNKEQPQLVNRGQNDTAPNAPAALADQEADREAILHVQNSEPPRAAEGADGTDNTGSTAPVSDPAGAQEHRDEMDVQGERETEETSRNTPAPEGVESDELTLEEARNVIADVGSCRGKTLAQIADRRPTTLRWYFTTCPDSSERLKKAARIVFESLNLQKTA